jgi:twitching motility protein PilT
MNFFKKKPGGEAAPSRNQMAMLNSNNWDDEIHEQVSELREETKAAESKPERVVTVRDNFTINELLETLVDLEGSDLHMAVGSPPAMRLHGSLTFCEASPMTQQKADEVLLSLLNAEKLAQFTKSGNIDFSHEIPNVARFRANFFRQHRGTSAVFRVIPKVIPTMEQLKLPPILKTVAELHQGLVLVTGPTGSGKSTTLASIIDHINSTSRSHIITIEDPIEFFHKSKMSLINHREIGDHAVSFADSLRASLREDPDIILVGEMRDLETIYNAIKAAETGHLVFATLHTNSAAKTIDRIIDVFPAKQQSQIRTMLSESLKAVVAQQLLRKLGGGGRVACHEILLSASGFGAMVRESKTAQLNNFIMTHREDGMQSMDSCLVDLLRQKKISLETAKDVMTDPTYFKNQGFPVDLG